MKKCDAARTAWERNRDLAIKFGKSFVENMMENYHEPTRAGTPKGAPIGFSGKKKRAALLMILYNPPSGLGLKEIAKIADVPPGVLRIWRTQAAFKKAESEACNAVAKTISDGIDFQVMREEIQSVRDARLKDDPNVPRLSRLGDKTILRVLKSERGTPLLEHFIMSEVPKKQIQVVEIDDSYEVLKDPFWEGIDQDQLRNSLLKLFFFFNLLVVLPIMKFLEKKVESLIPGYVWLVPLISRNFSGRDEKSLRKWKNRPEVKATTRMAIKASIELISDPEAMEKLGPKRIQEAAENLKTFIFNELDL